MFLWFSAKKIRGLSNLCWSKVITATIALHVIGHLWMLTYNRIKKNKTNSCTTCSLFEEVSSCAGVCCTLHLLKLPNQVWNIMVFSYITILSKLLSIQSVTVIATCLSLKWSVPSLTMSICFFKRYLFNLEWHLKVLTLILPFSGMRRTHGREMGVIECWYTKADKLPERK